MHLILEGLQGETFQLVEIFAKSRQVDLVLASQGAQSLFEGLDVRGKHLSVRSSINHLLNVHGFVEGLALHLLRGLDGSLVPVNLLPKENQVVVGYARHRVRLGDLGGEHVETLVYFLELHFDFLALLLDFSEQVIKLISLAAIYRIDKLLQIGQ